MIEEIKKILINAKISNVYVGWAGSLNIGIGNILNPEEKNRFDILTDWYLNSESASWRIINKEVVLSGSYNQDKSDSEIFPSTLYSKILDVQINHLKDLTLFLENQTKIDFRNLNGIEKDHCLYNISNRNGIGFSLFINGDWVSWTDLDYLNKNEIVENNEKIQEIAKTFSLKIEKSDSTVKTNNCDNCIYFRAINGPYEFWDFGLCSSEESIYFGKAKFKKHSCNAFESY
ncbi:hypothetical protein LEP1GSC202_0341 [Leptospira yanagawae serovar Saopaulo str. Sao Paulo = ATCC 700523]|uniref:Uncharacterized protein n=1 Tax=Leptospira yanagawae serovar Saopaulo str. Sao Paulo = ATCC 700523 TaxID=1249483 RepID=A0A5E8HBE4_9LEPT|nr:hypothetical protein [Leptospira yanagawae]EOQ88549.1 hypothetical protein LEP1GSC202_0341 [Leptospira yanagawae serovar Saopaulo str. Sao Paulo = ATCC 700523]